jgi:hypothetical protein
MKRKSKQTVTPAILVLGAVAVGAIVLAQTTKPAATGPAVTSKAKKSGDAPIVITSLPDARKPLSFYTGAVRNDLFTGTVVPEPKPVVTVTKPVKPVVTTPTLPTAPAVVDPFADYAYTGTVNMGGQMVALIENTKTREGQYYKQGDSFLGGTISEITERGVSVNIAGAPKTLAKTDNFKLTPLDKSAPFLQGQPQGQPGAPGAPGAPTANPQPGGPGGMAMPGMGNMSPERQQRMQQFMQNMTPEQRQQMQNRWMNRSFEGGRGGGRGNRDGGGGGGERRRDRGRTEG